MLRVLRSIKGKLILLMMLVVLLVTILMGISQNYSVSRNYEEMDAQRRALLEDNIIKLMRATDSIYQMIEVQMQREAQTILNRIAAEYSLEGLSGIRLEDHLGANGGYHLYIIDRHNTVIQATYQPDIGLDFAQFQGVAEFFEGIREKGVFFSDRLSLSSLENNLTKYSYLPSHDGLYLFEIGHRVDQDQAIPDALNFGSFGEVVSKNQSFVLSALLYGRHGLTLHEDAAQVREVDPAYRPYYEQALTSLKPIIFEGSYQGEPASFKYLPFSLEHTDELRAHTVIELIYSNADLQASRDRMLRLTIMTVLAGAAVIAVIAVMMSNTLLAPLRVLHKGIMQVARGNYVSPINIRSKDEFAYIADQFNGMTEKVRQSMDDRLRKEEEIKALYEHEASLNEDLQRMMEANEQNYFQTIKALANAEEEKDAYTRGHCERVMNYALGIGKALGLPEKDLDSLRFGAILHDIGKIGVPEHILNKETPLTNEEFALIRQHPSMGIRILGDLTFLKDSIRIVHEHHERYDGLGYPARKKGEDIDLLARIVGVADAYDAMTSKPPYRKEAMTREQAMRELQKESGKQFDPVVVEAFIRMLNAEC